ncbi:MAG: hypothetical protein WKF96_01145 [Solirubrobacteraceae bacterium]
MTSSSYRYPVRRGELGRTHYASREAYLASTLRNLKGAKLCQAMHTIPGAERPGEKHPWEGFPWLTPVIGSGCLELPVTTNFTAERLAQIVTDHVDELMPRTSGPAFPGLEAIRGFAGEFTRELVDTRTSEAQRGPLDGRDDPDVSDVAVRMVVLAALLTRFFHLARSLSGTALSRWDDDVAELAYSAWPDHDARVLASPRKVALQARLLIKALRGDLEDAPSSVRSASAALLTAIGEGLTPPGDEDARPMTLRLGHLRLVTEIAWYFLHEKSPVYPGWTDLLVRMMLREGQPALAGSGRPRPRFTTIGDLPDVVKHLLSDVTGESWRSYKPTPDDTPSTRDRLYLAVAEVLWAQSDALTQMAEPERRKLPVASAFVTSFDLELDMAMVATSAGRSFYVAVPVHVLQMEDSNDAAFCWLVAQVEPLEEGLWEEEGRWEEQLTRLRQPDNWRLLTELNVGGLPLSNHPTIVHLNGCPLFAAPRLDDDRNALLARDLRSVSIEDGAVVRHAVTIDEYLALRQSSAELFWTTYKSQDQTSRALPRLLTGDGASLRNPRYWMSLGVPMDDPAVRNRFVAQMTLNWVRDHAHAEPPATSSAVNASSAGGPSGQLGGPPASLLGDAPGEHEAAAAIESPRTDVHGVAVNTRMSADEVGLLNWLGLDVIDGDCREFTADLRHYAAHVRESGIRPPLGEPCKLGEGTTRP